MKDIINIAQIVISVLLVTVILLQQRGTTLGGAFGGESNVYSTRRGFEKVLYIATIVLAIVFVALAIVNVVL
jgi:protein translocase SecG subunit